MAGSRGHFFVYFAVGILIAGQAGAFAIGVQDSGWITDTHNTPILKDFMAFWTASRFAADGKPWLAYDWNAVRQAQAVLTAIKSNSFQPFPYPPQFLLLVLPLGLMPYPTAFILFAFATAIFYIISIVAITGRKEAALFAVALPVFAVNLFVGQNGCLTAGLLGTALLASDASPRRGGAFLGLLTYKPQFGPLIPLVLTLERRWNVIGWAAGTTATLVTLAYLSFGGATFSAYVKALSLAVTSGLGDGVFGFERLQSAYGLFRFLGGSEAAGIIAQVAVDISCVLNIIWVWRKSDTQSLRYAALISCTLLFTPHVLSYDFVMLATALAFLFRDQAFDAFEWTAILFVCAVLCVFLFTVAPIAFIGPVVALFLVARRIQRRGRTRQAPVWI
jgi:Glycosyltransferase family 87